MAFTLSPFHVFIVRFPLAFRFHSASALSPGALALPSVPRFFEKILSADQREAFDVLGRLTSPTDIVAASLNSGAIELYAGRDAVRPAYWSEHEWLTFIDNALSDGRKVFLLVDGEEMKHPKEVVKSRYHLAIVAQLPLPYFYPEGRSTNAPIILYEVIPQSSSNFQEAER